MSETKRDESKVKTCEEIMLLVDKDKLSNTRYSHYTNFNAMLKIVNTKSILFGAIKDMNDIYEKENSQNTD